MPRIEFRQINELLKWINKLNKSERFFAYHTDADELILAPNRSTQPVLYAYLEHTKSESLVRFEEQTSIPMFQIRRWVWSADTGREYVSKGEL